MNIIVTETPVSRNLYDIFPRLIKTKTNAFSTPRGAARDVVVSVGFDDDVRLCLASLTIHEVSELGGARARSHSLLTSAWN